MHNPFNTCILTLHTAIFLLPERERELCVRERLAEDKLARYLLTYHWLDCRVSNFTTKSLNLLLLFFFSKQSWELDAELQSLQTAEDISFCRWPRYGSTQEASCTDRCGLVWPEGCLWYPMRCTQSHSSNPNPNHLCMAGKRLLLFSFTERLDERCLLMNMLPLSALIYFFLLKLFFLMKYQSTDL